MELLNEDKIGELEQKIDTLITSYKGMKEEHEKLLMRAKELETENTELKTGMANVRAERELLIEKVTKIIEKVEQVEV
jgi:regulator of replication initiation timing